MEGSNSPVFSASEKIIDLFDARKTIKAYSYQNADHFNELWSSIQHDPCYQANFIERRALIIVWDGFPSRPENAGVVNIARYITPLDWAVAFSLSMGQRAEVSSLPDVRIFIIDAGELSGSDSGTLRYFEQFHKRTAKAMPWLRLFSPGKEDQVWSFENLLLNVAHVAHSLNGWFASDTVSSKVIPSIREATKNQKLDLDVINTFLAAYLTRPSEPGDHHAIANIIGPLLLMAADQTDLQVKALQILLSQLGLLPREIKTDRGLSLEKPWVNLSNQPWKRLLDEVFGGSKAHLEIILIDDMFQLGWGKLLCWALHIKYNPPAADIRFLTEIGRTEDGRIIIKACSSPDYILQRLRKLSETSRDQRFKFKVDESPEMNDALEVLFLDLRLFSGKTFDEELSYFKKLVSIAQKLNSRRNLPWPGIDQAEMEGVKTWVEGTDHEREDPVYAEALTFLPRLLSLADLSLPIIIFSSTGRRDIVEKLKPYGNIITALDKPKFTSSVPLDTANQTRRKFLDAIEKAMTILKVRKKCRFINECRDSYSERKKFDGNAHVELFIDESFPDNENQVFVGGCFAVFLAETKEEAQKKADCFDDDLVKNGIRFFQSFGMGVQASQIKSKKEDVSNELLQSLQVSPQKPNHLGLIRLGYKLPLNHGAFDLFNPHSADNLYRLTLIALIEIFLSESLPALIGEGAAQNASISIFAGTRVKAYNDDLNGKGALNEAKYHLGLESFEGRDSQDQKIKHLLYSISRDSIYPIVTHILSANKLRRHIERAIGIKLPYEVSAGNTRFPSYFICRKCKEIRSINARIGEEIVERNETLFNVAQLYDIRYDKNNNKYGVGKLMDNGGSFLVFRSEWRDIDNAEKNDHIIYSQLIQDSKGRMQAKGVRFLTNEEKELYEKVEKEYSLADSVSMKCACRNEISFVPDYRALHYVADEVLNEIGKIRRGEGLGRAIKYVPGAFDDILNDDLETTIETFRDLNTGDFVSALVRIKLSNDGLGKYRVKPKILQRMALQLDDLKGDEFMRIAARIQMDSDSNNIQKGKI